jgi:prepilin-type N-terminal cleavage/methylation domain-containing protein/prepilin-type processing-associated H-X9-DG protein
MERRGLTLVELLLVIAIIAILAAMLLPALSGAKINTRGGACLNHEKQLDIAWQMYADESGGILVSNGVDFKPGGAVESPSNCWVTGNSGLDTNITTITDGTLYPYFKNLYCYRCPSDTSLVLGTIVPILRNYSLSCFMGGPQADVTNFGVNPLHRTSQITNPSKSLTFIDEDDSTIDDGHFLYRSTSNQWLNIPGRRHENRTPLTFADGHVESWKWQGPLPSPNSTASSPASIQDLTRLQQTAPDGN